MRLPVGKFIGIIQLKLRRRGINQEISFGSLHNLSKQFDINCLSNKSNCILLLSGCVHKINNADQGGEVGDFKNRNSYVITIYILQ